MAWYYGTFSCGHEGRVNIIGPGKEREWKREAAFSKMCSECWEKHLELERERANKEAEEKAKEMELPKLSGTERQVAWANTLRQKLIDNLTHLAQDEIGIREIRAHYNLKINGEDILKIRDYIMSTMTRAKYYIDYRNEYITYTLEREMKDALKTEEEIIEDMQEKKVKQEAIVYPENKTTNVPVDIVYKNDIIQAYFEKNEEFIRIVKDIGYKWNGVWERKVDYTNGSMEDRVAELGNKLLNAGFPIIILDEKTRNKAINGEYEQECTKWIYIKTSGNYKGRLLIRWQGWDDDLYNLAKSLPGARWDSGMAVRIEHIAEVEEFAELYGFKFSKGAEKAIKEYEKIIRESEVVKPVEVEAKEEKDGLAEILETSNEVLDDLIDD